MLPLSVLSQTAYEPRIEPIVISLIVLLVIAGWQRQGIHVMWRCETTRKQLYRDHLRKDALPQVVIIVRPSCRFLDIPGREV